MTKTKTDKVTDEKDIKFINQLYGLFHRILSRGMALNSHQLTALRKDCESVASTIQKEALRTAMTHSKALQNGVTKGFEKAAADFELLKAQVEKLVKK